MMRERLYEASKRLLDLIASAVGLVVLAPLFAVIAICVKLNSRGPVFYRGTRTGRHGVPFRILKFRTMRDDAELSGGGTTALNDPRVTSVGAFLRRWKIDELPQLVNVLTGEMSLVGPRPELPRYTSAYTEDVRAVLSVRPGITDFSSIRFRSLDRIVGSVNADGFFESHVLEEKNSLRLRYVRERSFVVDCRILLATIRAVLLAPEDD